MPCLLKTKFKSTNACKQTTHYHGNHTPTGLPSDGEHLEKDSIARGTERISPIMCRIYEASSCSAYPDSRRMATPHRPLTVAST